MKVVVSHPDKQHSPALIRVLHQAGILTQFFTLFAANRIPVEVPALRKRKFGDIPPSRITHFPIYWTLGRVLNWDGYRRMYPWFDQKVGKTLEKYPADIVISYENANAHTFKKAKEQGKITVLDLAAVHHHHYQTLYQKYPAYRNILPNESYFKALNEQKKEAYAYTDYCFCLSSYAKKTLIAGGLRPEQIFIINLGTKLDLFQAKPSYRVEDGPLKLLFVGRISALKGIPELIEVMRLPEAQKAFQLELIGPKNPGEELLDDLPTNVQYSPFLPHEKLVKKYQEADVFINFSYTDSWAQTVIEAMACGTPAIVTEHTGARDAVQQGGGWVLPIADTTPLRELLFRLKDDREEIISTGQKARLIAEQYSWDQYDQKILQALRTIHQRE